MKSSAQTIGLLAVATGMNPKRMECLINGTRARGHLRVGLVGHAGQVLEGSVARTEVARGRSLPVFKSFYREDPARSTVYENALYKMQGGSRRSRSRSRHMPARGSGEGVGAADRAQGQATRRAGGERDREAPVGVEQGAGSNLRRPQPGAAEKRQKVDGLRAHKNVLAKAAMTAPTGREADDRTTLPASKALLGRLQPPRICAIQRE